MSDYADAVETERNRDVLYDRWVAQKQRIADLEAERDELARAHEASTKHESDLIRKVADLEAIIATHDLCHNQHGKVDARAFADGCAAEQWKLYGCAPDADRVGQLEVKLRAADVMARVCDDWVKRGLIDARSALSDARLDYGEPFEYEYPEQVSRNDLEAALKHCEDEKQTVLDANTGNIEWQRKQRADLEAAVEVMREEIEEISKTTEEEAVSDGRTIIRRRVKTHAAVLAERALAHPAVVKVSK